MYKVILLVFLSSAYAQISMPGTCSNEINLQLLNLTAVPTWQEVQRTPNRLESGQCSSVHLPPLNSTQPYVLSIREVVNSTARFLNGTVSATTNKTTVNFSGVVIDLRVLMSDFQNYALIYGCRNVANNIKEVYGWKLSRNTTLSSSDLTTINAALNGTDLQNVTWTTVSHSAEACKVNAAVTSQVSLVLCILAVVAAVAK